LTAQFVARRRFLPETDAAWAESWRRRLAEAHARALECYATACLELGGAELPGAERAARELLEVAPMREAGHLVLMRALAARGNVAEALAAYEAVRVRLREELGIDPGRALQDAYADLLA
jgi:DNA-binding SARP family transcriptional activator